ncbi:helix-turn-helix domain-containing protein [Saccharopolyspora cebuensis]|uniref:helix-turn-helix domain-containing protein n=1 Tax=Saccharopolyspora cebuensis TaxID=418759 RepID=UPI0031ED5B0A
MSVDQRLIRVDQGAAMLGVSPRRVRGLVANGKLRAARPGRALLLDPASVQRRRDLPKHAGRPLSPRMAWALLWWVSGHRPAWVSPTELARVRHYARSRPWSDWPHLLRNRAERAPVRMLPGTLRRLRDQPGVAAGGISAAAHYGLDLLPAGDEAELYLPQARFDELLAARRARPDSPDPNVVLHVVPDFPSAPGLQAGYGQDGSPLVPAAAVAADLLDDADERSVRAAHHLLDQLSPAAAR